MFLGGHSHERLNRQINSRKEGPQKWLGSYKGTANVILGPVWFKINNYQGNRTRLDNIFQICIVESFDTGCTLQNRNVKYLRNAFGYTSRSFLQCSEQVKILLRFNNT